MFRPTLSNRSQVLTLALVVAAIAWGLTDVRNRARIDPDDPAAHKTDFTVYTEAGAAFFDGRDPYAVASPRGWHYLYPPLFAILVAPLAQLPSQWQAVCWYFISVLMVWGCWLECRKIARFLRNSGDKSVEMPAWICWVAVNTAALPVFNCLQRGQVGVMVLYLLLLGFRLIVIDRTRWATALGGLSLAGAVTLKLTPLLPVLCLLTLLLGTAWFAKRRDALSVANSREKAGKKHEVKRPSLASRDSVGGLFDYGVARNAMISTALGIVLLIVVVPSMFVGAGANVRHLQTWMTRVVTNQNIGTDNDFNPRGIRNQSLTNAAYRGGNWLAAALGAGPDDNLLDDISLSRNVEFPLDAAWFKLTIMGIKLSLLGLLAGAIYTSCRAGDPRLITATFALSCLATLVISPLSWGHHYTLLLPAALTMPWLLSASSSDRLTKIMAAVPLALVLAHYMLLDWTGRAGLLGMGISVWFAVATAMTIRIGLKAARLVEGREMLRNNDSRSMAVNLQRAA